MKNIQSINERYAEVKRKFDEVVESLHQRLSKQEQLAGVIKAHSLINEMSTLLWVGDNKESDEFERIKKEIDNKISEAVRAI